MRAKLERKNGTAAFARLLVTGTSSHLWVMRKARLKARNCGNRNGTRGVELRAKAINIYSARKKRSGLAHDGKHSETKG